MRIDSLGGIFSAVVTTYIVYGGRVSAGAAGFTISIVLSFTREILWWVRFYNLLEVQGKLPQIWRRVEYLTILASRGGL